MKSWLMVAVFMVAALVASTGCDAVFGFEERPFTPSTSAAASSGGAGGMGASNGTNTGGSGGTSTATGGSGVGGSANAGSGGAGGSVPTYPQSFVIFQQRFQGINIPPDTDSVAFSAKAMVSSLDPLPNGASAYAVVKCFSSDYAEEYCGGGSGAKSTLLTKSTPTDSWMELKVTTMVPSTTVHLHYGLELSHCEGQGACPDVGGTVYWDSAKLQVNGQDPGIIANRGFNDPIGVGNWEPFGAYAPFGSNETLVFTNYGLIAHGAPLKASSNPNNMTFNGYLMTQGGWMRSHYAPAP